MRLYQNFNDRMDVVPEVSFGIFCSGRRALVWEQFFNSDFMSVEPLSI